MNRNYIYLSILILVLSLGVLFLPERDNSQHMSPDELMLQIMQPTRYISTDEVARMIIEKDPTLELIDVRSTDEYSEFRLENSLNIPMDSIMVEAYQDYLGIEDMNAVFYSNDDIKADQTWVIAKRLGYKNIYVMKGGLNCWVNTIIQPVKPEETSSLEEFELYSFRKGASIYFSGAVLDDSSDDTKSGVIVARKKKKAVAEGGC
jgi:rhodanese-related sulfurtransferase